MLLYQVNRILTKRNIFCQLLRYAHNESSTRILYPLESRKLLKISGEDVPVFLQGLVTNDMGHFEEGAKSMYAMFLNNKGRVLYDTLVHKWESDNSFLIECDKKVIGLLYKHLKIYKLKRRVDVQDMSNDFNVWCFISPAVAGTDAEIKPYKDINIYKDPRLTNLGFRFVTASSMKSDKVASSIGQNISIENEDKYKLLRYKLGVSEGADDLPPGTCFPLEVNCDYLHGVSFHKGCYIGQEVTARVHHTGVVRKRIMPLKFASQVTDSLEKDSVISASDKPKSNLGKLKAAVQDYGLGLMRIKEALDSKVLTVGTHRIETFKPSWWPVEAPKEKISAPKSESTSE